MYNPILLRHTENSRLFFTGDQHFFHGKLTEQRGFKSVEEMNEALINNYNSCVGDNDLVINLGDMFVGAGTWPDNKDKCQNIVERLNGKIYYITGNHNSFVKHVWKNEIKNRYNEEIEVYPLTVGKITFLGPQALFKIKTEKRTHFVFAAHFSFLTWIDMNHGIMHICGHSHGSLPQSQPEYKGAKRLDVGVDNFGFKPLLLDDFLAIMETKKIEIVDHHDDKINKSF